MKQTGIVGSKHYANKWQFLNATTLKFLAVFLMFLDHIHQMFVHVGAPEWLTMAGRLVFPIFLFAASESFHYTHDKKRYLQRLLFASWGMTALTLALQNLLPNPNVVLMNNAFSTFFVAALYMLFWDWLVDGVKAKNPRKVIKAILCCFIPVLCAFPLLFISSLVATGNVPFSVIKVLMTVSLFIPNLMVVEGGSAMVALGVGFYIFRKHRFMQIAVLLLLSAIVYMVGNNIQSLMCLAAIPIALYNGERGKGMKNFFYIFYPAHIGLLYMISTIFFS